MIYSFRTSALNRLTRPVSSNYYFRVDDDEVAGRPIILRGTVRCNPSKAHGAATFGTRRGH